MSLEKQTLYYFLKQCARDYAQQPAFRTREGQGWREYKYDEWYDWIVELSTGLMELGVKNKTKVALIADNRVEWMVCSMAITTCGAIDVPRGTDATEEDLEYILNHTEAEYIILENSKVADKIKNKTAKFKNLKHLIIMDGKKPVIRGKKGYTLDEVRALGRGAIEQKGNTDAYHKQGAKTKEDDLASIIYTSGTTGTPKGVMLTNQNLVWEVMANREVTQLTSSDSTMCLLPPWHIAERLLETVIIGVGGCGNITSIAKFAEDAKELQPTFLVSVPRVWENIYQKVNDGVAKLSPVAQKIFKFSTTGAITYTKALDLLTFKRVYHKSIPPKALVEYIGYLIAFLPLLVWKGLGWLLVTRKVPKRFGGKVRYAVSGAGALPYEVDLFFRAVGIPIVEAYGMTETTGVSTARELDNLKFKTLGKPIEGVEIQLRTLDGEIITKNGVKGEAWHKGPHIMKGYYKEKAKTNAVLDENGYLNSGDLLMRTLAGDFVYCGRSKDTIVLLGGENLEPGPIEDKLRESPYISQVMIVGQDQKTLGAIITPAEEAVTAWAEKNGIELGPRSKWNQNKALRTLYKQIIKERINTEGGFKAFERVTNFHILHKDFEPGQEMTQTMKIRRPIVNDMYEKEIAALWE